MDTVRAYAGRCYTIMDVDGVGLTFTVESTWEGFEKWVCPRGILIVSSKSSGPIQRLIEETLPSTKGVEFVVYSASPDLIPALGLQDDRAPVRPQGLG